jgi:hypothetical protein
MSYPDLTPTLQVQSIRPHPEIAEKLLTTLGAIEQTAGHDLALAMKDKGIEPDGAVGRLYQSISEKSEAEKRAFLTKISDTIRALPTALRDSISKSLVTKILVAGTSLGIGTGVLTEIAQKGLPASDVLQILINKSVEFAGTGVSQVDFLSVVSALAATTVYVGVPALAVNAVSEFVQSRTLSALDKSNLERDARNEIRDGEANLSYFVGPNVHIEVGKSDPSVETLIKKFKKYGITAITFWDERKGLSDETNKYWLKTHNEWTRADILAKGALSNTLCCFSEVSNGQDVFLSRREGAFKRTFEDMSDSEVDNSNQVRNYLRKLMGLDPIISISVTNPKRIVDAAVGAPEDAEPKDPDNPYGVITVAEVASENPNLELVDADQIIMQEIAGYNKKGLPLEILADREHLPDYKNLFTSLIKEYNATQTSPEKALRYKKRSEEDTLTVIYGEDDQTTIGLLKAYRRKASMKGDLVTIINDPQALEQLPPDVVADGKIICVGEIMAERQFERFIRLVKKGTVKLPDAIYKRMEYDGLFLDPPETLIKPPVGPLPETLKMD